MSQGKMYTIEEMAEECGVCVDTVRRSMKANGYTGILSYLGHHKTVLLFTEFQFQTFKDAWNYAKVIEKNYYTAAQVAEMAGCSTSWVSAIACKNDIERIVRPNHITKVAYYSKENAEKIINIVSARKAKVIEKQKAKEGTEVPPELEDEAALHPLIKDKNFLRLSFFPDTTPKCFEDLGD